MKALAFFFFGGGGGRNKSKQRGGIEEPLDIAWCVERMLMTKNTFYAPKETTSTQFYGRKASCDREALPNRIDS